MGQLFPLNNNEPYTSEALYSPCASHFFPALLDMSPTPGFREAKTGIDVGPLGMFVNFRITPHCAVNIRDLLDGLIEEIVIRSGSRQQRPVQSLQLRLPTTPLEPAYITELVYHLSRHFKLAHKGLHRFTAQLPLNQADDNTLALLKGLGFSQVILEVHANLLDKPLAADQLLAQIGDALSRAHTYPFSDVILQLNQLSEAVCQCLRHLTSNATRYGLTHININLAPIVWSGETSNETGVIEYFQRTYHMLRDSGFRTLGNDTFVAPDHFLAKGQREHSLKRTPLGYNVDGIDDICGLGPGSITRENNHFYRNIPSVQGYLQRTATGHSPVSCSRSIAPGQKLVQLIIDQLLCFHSADLDYLRSRYQLDINRIRQCLHDYCAPNTTEGDWYNIHNHQLSLTESGVYHLHHICHLLAYHY